MFGDLGKIMKIAGEMKRKMPEMQARLAESQFEAASGGGAVKAVVNGKLGLVDIHIDPQVLADARTDAAMLEDLIKAAVSAAQEKSTTAAAEMMKELTGGMELPGFPGL